MPTEPGDPTADAAATGRTGSARRTGTSFAGSAPRLDPPAGLRAERRRPAGDADLGAGARAPSATRSTSRDAADGDVRAARPRRPRRAGRAAPAVRRHDRHARRGALVRRRRPVRRRTSRAARRDRVASTPLAEPAGPVHGRRRRRRRGRRAAPAVAADDRQRAPLPRAVATDTTGGRLIGAELTAALRAAHEELGVTHVRAHAILCDDLGVYREVDGDPVHDFSGWTGSTTTCASLGLYPVVELSFMPHDLATDPSQDGVRLRRDRLAAEGLGPLARPGPRPGRAPGRAVRPRRGGRALVVRGLERGQPRGLLVGHARGVPAAVRRHRGRGARPSTRGCASADRPRAAAGWVEELLAHAERIGRAGRLRLHPHLRLAAAGLPADAGAVRPRRHADLVDRVGRDARPTSTRSATRSSPAPSCCAAWPRRCRADRGAVLLGGLRPLRGARPAAGAAARRLRAAHGRRAAQAALVGAGDARAARADRGSPVRVAATAPGRWSRRWPPRDDGRRGRGAGLEPHPRPDQGRRVRRARPHGRGRGRGLAPGAAYRLHHERVDDDHSNIAAVWGRLREDGQDWPTDEQWDALREADRLERARARPRA